MRIESVGMSKFAVIVSLVALSLSSFGLPASVFGQAPATVRFQGTISGAAVAWANYLGPIDSTANISFAFALPLRNQADLDDLLRRLHDPADPLYGQYLTPAEFTARFGPTQEDYDVLTEYARSIGLAVDATHPNRLLLDVSGPVAAIEAAFNIHMLQFQTPDGRQFFAPDNDPLIPASVAALIDGVIGLDNAAVWHSHTRTIAGAIPAQVGTGPNGGLSPSDILTAYNLNGISANGTGQALGLFELDGYLTSDVNAYNNYFGLSGVTLQNVLVDSFSGNPGSGAAEVTLDIELQIAVAQRATKIFIYEGPNTNTGVVDTYNRIANDDVVAQISTSWGLSENQTSASVRNSENSIFQQMAAQGQSIYAASGDSGAYDNGSTLSVDDPASQPYMVGVGGTELFLNSGETYNHETTWNRGSPSAGAGGGGISTIWSVPSWQAAAAAHYYSISSYGSTTQRNVPDVSLDSDPNTGYAIYYNGGWTIYGGTSCAAPIWAAFTALVNQQRIANGSTLLGFANPALYSIAQGSNYSSDFHDIADGSTNLYYPAVAGYDDATGWGSFNGSNLWNDLVNYGPANNPPLAPTNLTATPGNAIVTLNWIASGGATSYTVYRGTASGGETSYKSGVTTNTYQDTAVTNGTTYYYKVTATNGAGTSGFSNEASAKPVSPPAAPTNLTATPGNAIVTLNWNASTGATSYTVYRGSVSGGETSYAAGITSNTYQDTSVTNGTTYYYKATASNSGGTSGFSNEASAKPVGPPAAPTNLTATPGNAIVTLNWNASTGAASYTVYRGTISGGETSYAAGITSNTYQDTSVTNGTTYYYKATATNSGGTSGFSNEASAKPVGPPAAPTNLTATPGNAIVTLNWNASTGAASYTVYRGTVSGGETSYAAGITTNTYQDTGVTNGTTYYYEVTATNSSGTSGFSNEASAKPVSPPTVPTNLTATPGNTSVTLNWNVSTRATSYTVYRGTVSGGETSYAAGITTNTYQDTGVTNGTTYYYEVTATNSGGTSGFSNEAFATPGGTPVAAALVSPSGAILTATPTYVWNAVSNSTSYYLWVNDSTGTKIQTWYTAAQAVCSSGTGACSVTPSTAVSGASQWWIQTQNTYGYGPWSSPLSFTLPTPPAATLVSPSGTITITAPTYVWDAVSNSTWYYLWVNDSKGAKIQIWYTAAQAGCSSGTGTCSVTPAPGLVSGSATWWIQTWNNYGYGPWSSPLNFLVSSGLPSATLVSPSGIITTTTPTYVWNAVSNSTWYYLWVNDSTGTKIQTWYTAAQVGCSSGTGTCSVTPATGLGSGSATWWIETWNDNGYGPWSDPLTFMVASGSSSLTLVSPWIRSDSQPLKTLVSIVFFRPGAASILSLDSEAREWCMALLLGQSLV